MLEVGHTHSKVDQLFSTVHQRNARHSEIAPSDAIVAMHDAYTDSAQRPTIVLVEECVDW